MDGRKRKRFFVFGMVAFLIGSMLCGTAQSIVQLSMYRAIQGIGGGALIPVTFTIIYDIGLSSELGGHKYDWNSVQIVGLFTGLAVRLNL